MSSPVAQRLQIIFRKDQRARFLSHLDLMATFEYAVRRARLPIELSEGFNPRPRMSAAAPLALGHLGAREILDVSLRERRTEDEVCRRLQASVPLGITILSVHEVPRSQKPAASRLWSATYRVDLASHVDDLARRVADLLQTELLIVDEELERGVRTRDLRPFILSLDAYDTSTICMEVRLSGEGSVRPEQVLKLLSVSTEAARITRERIDVLE